MDSKLKKKKQNEIKVSNNIINDTSMSKKNIHLGPQNKTGYSNKVSTSKNQIKSNINFGGGLSFAQKIQVYGTNKKPIEVPKAPIKLNKPVINIITEEKKIVPYISFLPQEDDSVIEEKKTKKKDPIGNLISKKGNNIIDDDDDDDDIINEKYSIIKSKTDMSFDSDDDDDEYGQMDFGVTKNIVATKEAREKERNIKGSGIEDEEQEEMRSRHIGFNRNLLKDPGIGKADGEHMTPIRNALGEYYAAKSRGMRREALYGIITACRSYVANTTGSFLWRMFKWTNSIKRERAAEVERLLSQAEDKLAEIEGAMNARNN